MFQNGGRRGPGSRRAAGLLGVEMMQPQDPGGGLEYQGRRRYAEPGTRAQLLAALSLLQRRSTHSRTQDSLGSLGLREPTALAQIWRAQTPTGPQKLVPCHLRPGQDPGHLPDEPHAAVTCAALAACSQPVLRGLHKRLPPSGRAASNFQPRVLFVSIGPARPLAPKRPRPCCSFVVSVHPPLLGGSLTSPSSRPHCTSSAGAGQPLAAECSHASFFRILNAHTYSGTCTRAHARLPAPDDTHPVCREHPAKTARQWAVKTQLLHVPLAIISLPANHRRLRMGLSHATLQRPHTGPPGQQSGSSTPCPVPSHCPVVPVNRPLPHPS